MSQEELRVIFAQLQTMADTALPVRVREDVAQRYNGLLERLTAMGYGVREFCIHDTDMETTQTGRRIVKPGIYTHKIKSLMLLFHIQSNDIKIGFNAPRVK